MPGTAFSLSPQTKGNKMKKTGTKEKLKKISGVAMFSAIAYIVTFAFHFKVGDFLTFDVKDAVFAICGMVFGPLSAIVSSFAVSLLEMVTLSGTGPYGALMNFASSASFAFFASLIYKYRRNYSGAIIGLVTSVFGMAAVMMGMNLIVTPYYTGMSASDVAGMIPTLLLPFNLTKAVLNAGLALLLYKPVSTALRAAKLTPPAENAKVKPLLTVLSTVAALLIIAAAVLYFIFVLKGQFSLGR